MVGFRVATKHSPGDHFNSNKASYGVLVFFVKVDRHRLFALHVDQTKLAASVAGSKSINDPGDRSEYLAAFLKSLEYLLGFSNKIIVEAERTFHG